jgi:hypothetical protein
MNESYVPGPFDEFRGVFEFDCSENLPQELKLKFRIGKFVPVQPPPDGCDLIVEPGPDSNVKSDPFAES